MLCRLCQRTLLAQGQAKVRLQQRHFIGIADRFGNRQSGAVMNNRLIVQAGILLGQSLPRRLRLAGRWRC